jgi:hypothetical protein
MPEMEALTPEPALTGPLAWKARGGWGWKGFAPAELGADTDGTLLLSLRICTTRPATVGEMSHEADRQDNAARSAILAALQADECWPAFLESKTELETTQQQIAALETERKTLEKERLTLAAKPRGRGPRLAEIAQLQAGIATRIDALQLEAEALRPIHDEARQRAETRARQLALDVVRRIRDEQQAALDAALADFISRHSDEWTAIASRLHARACRTHDGWVGSLRTFALARLAHAEPATEATASDA